MISNTSERSIRLIREFIAQEFLESTTVEVIKKRGNIVVRLKEIINQYKTLKKISARPFALLA